jgi:DNA-binding CsgD family transcriptional regulator
MATDEAHRAALLIADIYDAALDPSGWPEVLAQTCDFAWGIAAVLSSHDASRPEARFYFSFGDDPEYTRSYRDTYININPLLVPLHQRAQPGQIIAHSDLIPMEEYLASRFYREWVRPQGYLDGISAVLEKSPTSFRALIVARHERNGLVDEETRRRIGLLAPHFRRAAAITQTIEAGETAPTMLVDALDGLAAGMFLVAQDGRIIHANASGQNMLRDRSVVRSVAGRLKPIDNRVDRELRDAYGAAATGIVGRPTHTSGVLLGSASGEHWVAEVLPLGARARRSAGLMAGSVAAVFVRRAALDLASSLLAVGELYGLTSAELRVLKTIIEIGGVAETAIALGISAKTVRTHLENLFRKTATSRQADLARLVADFVSPGGG